MCPQQLVGTKTHTPTSVTIHDSKKDICLIKWLGGGEIKIIIVVTMLSFNNGCSYKIQSSIQDLKAVMIEQTATYPFNMLCFKCACICVKGQLKPLCPIRVFTQITTLEALKSVPWKVIMNNFVKAVTLFQFLLTSDNFDDSKFPSAWGFTSTLCMDIWIYNFFPHWHCSPTTWAIDSSFLRFLDHTQQCTTICRAPLYKLSDCHRDIHTYIHIVSFH